MRKIPYVIFLVLFMGVVIGILLEGFANFIRRVTHWTHGMSVTLAIAMIVLLLGGAGWLSAWRAWEQVIQLRQVLPKAIANFEEQARHFPFGDLLLQLLPSTGTAESRISLGHDVTGAIGTTIRVVADAVVVLLIALYVAAEPFVYVAGIELLIPRDRRHRAHEILMECAGAVRWWMIGQLFAMVTLGILSGVGLWLIGIQLPLALGLITGLFEFVPIAGAWVSAVPPLLLAMMAGRYEVLYVILLYLGLHILEGYILTPLIQRRTIFVPPALMLGAQLLLGVLFGFLGIVVTAPILAVTIPIIRMVYVEDILKEKVPELMAESKIEFEKD